MEKKKKTVEMEGQKEGKTGSRLSSSASPRNSLHQAFIVTDVAEFGNRCKKPRLRTTGGQHIPHLSLLHSSSLSDRIVLAPYWSVPLRLPEHDVAAGAGFCHRTTGLKGRTVGA